MWWVWFGFRAFARHQVTWRLESQHKSKKEQSTAFSTGTCQQTRSLAISQPQSDSFLPASTTATMQPQTADDRPNILADIKRDHATFFSLHRRFQEELGEHDKQLAIWQVCSVCAPPAG